MMGSVTRHKPTSGECASLPADYLQPHWYAAYTCANHEKRVTEQLVKNSVQHFLPLYETVRRWKDRKVRLQLPLFPGYVFVRIALRDRLRVLEISSVVRLVGSNGRPTALADADMEVLRQRLTRQFRVEPHPYLTVGRRVRIIRGPLAGLEGIVLRRKANFRVVLSLELIMRSIAVDVNATDVQPIWHSGEDKGLNQPGCHCNDNVWCDGRSA
jgi:transcription antitermination factor NusG